MKLLICVSVLVVVSIQGADEERQAKIDGFSRECKSQSGVSQDLINRARKGEVIDDVKLKDQTQCMFKKLGLATENGFPNTDYIKKQLRKVCGNEEEVDEITDKCFIKTGSALEAFYCISKTKPKFSPID